MFKKILLVVICMTLLLALYSSCSFQAKAETNNELSEKYFDEVAKVTLNNITVSENGTVTYNIKRMSEELKNNPYKTSALNEAKALNNKNFSLSNVDEENSVYAKNNISTFAASSSNYHCGVWGKKDNVKYWNHLNTCVGKKVKSVASLGGLLTGGAGAFIDNVIAGNWKPVRKALINSGKSVMSVGGIIVTLTTIQLTCTNEAQKKYPPGGCI